MARRCSGNVKASVRFDDARDQWVVGLTAGGKRKRVWVGGSHTVLNRRLAVDSPTAYTEAVHAAISFADHEGFDMQPDYDDSGVVVRQCRKSKRQDTLDRLKK